MRAGDALELFGDAAQAVARWTAAGNPIAGRAPYAETDAVLSDADAAELYDLLNPWDAGLYPADAFYDGLVAAADTVLDVGCGTGSMLHHARERGHAGRLVGLDPDPAALARARRRTDIEWVRGTAAEASWDREFDLVTMVSHAFQCLVGDDELRASLTAIRAALREGGLFAFETRHPQAHAWEGWNPANASEVVDASGRTLRRAHRVESVRGDVVTFTETTGDPGGAVLRVDRTTLRFLDVPTLGVFLAAAGFAVEAQYGDWRRGPVTGGSREIVTLARRV
jgi:SAM-dependent methyltransferase